jgi:hypothetical protein
VPAALSISRRPASAPVIARLQLQHAAVGGLGLGVAQSDQRTLGLVEAGMDHSFLSAGIADAVLDGTRVEKHRFLDFGQTGFDLLFGQQGLPFAVGILRCTSGQHECRCHPQAATPPFTRSCSCRSDLAGISPAHDYDPPIGMVCDCCKGK